MYVCVCAVMLRFILRVLYHVKELYYNNNNRTKIHICMSHLLPKKKHNSMAGVTGYIDIDTIYYIVYMLSKDVFMGIKYMSVISRNLSLCDMD